jgi:hypothetical protein
VAADGLCWQTATPAYSRQKAAKLRLERINGFACLGSDWR